MPSTMIYSRAAVILVPFPFTDLSGRKKRPGVVVSADSYNSGQDDLIIAQISSQVDRPVSPDEYEIIDWKGSGLLFPSVVRPKLFTLESSLVIRALGHLTTQEMDEVDKRLRIVLAL